MDNSEKFKEIIDGQINFAPEGWYDPEIGLADQFEHLDGNSVLGGIAIELAYDLSDATEQLAQLEFPDDTDDFHRTDFMLAEEREEKAEKLFMTFAQLYDDIETEVANDSNPADHESFENAIIRGAQRSITTVEELRDAEDIGELDAEDTIEYINMWAMQYRLEAPLHFKDLRWGF